MTSKCASAPVVEAGHSISRSSGVNKTGAMTSPEYRGLADVDDRSRNGRRARGGSAGLATGHGHQRRDHGGGQLQLDPGRGRWFLATTTSAAATTAGGPGDRHLRIRRDDREPARQLGQGLGCDCRRQHEGRERGSRRADGLHAVCRARSTISKRRSMRSQAFAIGSGCV